MPMLICVFGGRTFHFVCFVVLRLMFCLFQHVMLRYMAVYVPPTVTVLRRIPKLGQQNVIQSLGSVCVCLSGQAIDVALMSMSVKQGHITAAVTCVIIRLGALNANVNRVLSKGPVVIVLSIQTVKWLLSFWNIFKWLETIFSATIPWT